MTTLITSTLSSGSTEPLLVTGWAASNASRSVKHRLIGGGIAMSLVTPDPDSGTAELLYATSTDAYAARDLLREESTFELSSEVDEIAMTFVVESIDLELQEDRQHWLLKFTWQKVYT